MLFPKWLQKPTRPILRYSSVMNMGKANFRNSTKFIKINQIRYNDNFFRSGDQEKKEFYIQSQ